MVERRDHVLIGCLCPEETILRNFFNKDSSTYGPFLTERVILLGSPSANDILVRIFLFLAGFISFGRSSPRRDRMRISLRSLTFAAAVRVIHRIHDNPADFRAMPQPTHSARFPDRTRFMFHIPQDRKSTRLNSSHSSISYAVFCLKK